MIVELPFGRAPYRLDVGDRDVDVLAAADVPAAPLPLPEMLATSLDAADVPSARRVTVIVSDATRAEPRAAFLDAVRDRLAGRDVAWTVAIATGTHGPASLDELGLPAWVAREATIVNHDGHAERGWAELGTTARGTPVRVHPCVVDAELVVATGCIRPHYFAGFGAGVKAIFPGLGEATAIRTNHRWKTDPMAKAGIVDGNPCREDLEEAVGKLPVKTLLVNGVLAPDGAIRSVVVGDLRAAFRAGVARARPWFTVQARPAAVVVASDAAPVSSSVYQAAKIAAAVAPLVEPGGKLVVVAECYEGIGPLEVVNEAVLRIGVLPRLAPGVTMHLVSGLSAASVSHTLFRYAGAAERLLGAGRVVVAPRASQLLCEVAA